jgi:hypothetical protein
LTTAPLLRLAASLAETGPEELSALVRERLDDAERAVLDAAAAVEVPAAAAPDCVTTIKRLRLGRDCAAVQDEIDRLQERAAMTDGAFAALTERKIALRRRLEELT